jgi:hypothetical protein
MKRKTRKEKKMGFKISVFVFEEGNLFEPLTLK